MNDWQNLRVVFLAAIPLAMVLQQAGGSVDASPGATASTKRALELRSYNLKPGARDEFHRLASRAAVPMLRRWKIDVVAFGPSPHDDSSYFLMRSFADLADRQRSEDAFYGSDEWRQGPRDAVLALIESYTTVVLDVDAATIEGLRRP